MVSALLSTRGRQVGVLLSGPILLSVIMWIVNAVTGTAVGAGCGSGGVLLDAASRSRILDGLHRLFPFLPSVAVPHSACHSVPFSADLPNMTLAVTAGFAVSIYVVFNDRLRRLQSDLEETGLVSPIGLQQSGLAAELAGPPRRRPLSGPFATTLLAVGSVIGSATMYVWLYTHGPIFRDLAGAYTDMGSPGVTAELLRQNWWANHQYHPVNTAMGILVGAIGLFFAVEQGIAFLAFGTFLVRLRRTRRPVEFVPRWIDTDYGWGPCAGLVSLGYLAAFDFLASFSAALYMLRSDNPGPSQVLPIVLAVIATAGVLANAAFLLSLMHTIRKLFRDSVTEERRRIRLLLRPTPAGSATAGPAAEPTPAGPTTAGPAAAGPSPAVGGPPEDRLFLLTEALSLTSAPTYPIGGRMRRLITFVPPFVAAAWTFGNQVYQAFGG